MKLSFWNSKKFLALIVLNIFVLGVAGLYVANRFFLDDKDQLIFVNGEVLGTSDIDAEDVTVNFSIPENPRIISHELFAGAHNPNLEDLEVWNQMADIGITGLRKDFFLGQSFPNGVTLEGYKQNVNGIQSIENWDQDHLNKTLEIYRRADARGWDVTGIVAYSPKWLNVNSNKEHSYPRDWAVYEDVVEKAYRLYRPYLDRVEIWNEPDVEGFLDMGNTGISRPDAYAQIFVHASRAIRRVDAEINDGKVIPIGGPAIADSRNNQPLLAVLKNEEARSYLNFVSYHDYEQHQNSWKPIFNILEKENLDLPVYVTEWSKTFNIKKSTPEILTNLGISYTADKIISYANAGVRGANYFALQPIVPDSAWGNVGYLGFYMDSDDSLLPLHKTWLLMSKTLALGKGQSQMLNSSGTESLKSLAFVNPNGQRGYVVSNSSNQDQLLRVTIENRPASSFVRMYSYAASSNHDAVSPVDAQLLESNSFELLLPANSVVGVLFEEVPRFEYQLFRLISMLNY